MAKASTVLATVRRAVKNRKTEAGERNAVALVLSRYGHREPPKVQKVGDADGRTRRVYLWVGALGDDDLVLVTGPGYEGRVLKGSEVRIEDDGEDSFTAWSEGSDWTGKSAKGAAAGMARAVARGAEEPLSAGPKKSKPKRKKRAAAPKRAKASKRPTPGMEQVIVYQLSSPSGKPTTYHEHLKRPTYAVDDMVELMRARLQESYPDYTFEVVSAAEYSPAAAAAQVRRVKAEARLARDRARPQFASSPYAGGAGMMGSYRARQSRAAKKAAEERIETLYNNVVAGESERSAMQQADMMARARTQADTIVREAEVTEADRAALRHEVGRLDLTILEPSLQRVQQREAAAPAADDDAAMMADFAALLKAALAD